MLSKSPVYISFLCTLDEAAYKFYNGKDDLYEVTIFTRCYIQHALRPYIDSEINNIRHLIKITLINKGIKFIDLPSIFYLETIQWCPLLLLISKIRNTLLFVANITSLSVIQYLQRCPAMSFHAIRLFLFPLTYLIAKLSLSFFYENCFSANSYCTGVLWRKL